MEGLKRLPLLAEAPFVVSDSIFVNPKCRGARLPPTAETDPTEWGEVFLRKPIRVHDARSLGQAPRLDDEGFQLLKTPIRLNFGDRKLVANADVWRRTEPKTRPVDCRLIHGMDQGWYYFPWMTADESLIFKQ